MLTPLTPLLLRALITASVVSSVRSSGGFSALDALSDSFSTYFTLGLSAIITEELSPIFGGFAWHEGELRPDRVIIAVTMGSWLATTLLYWAGWAKWEFLRRRFPKVRSAGTVALRVVKRNPWRASFLVRFAIGARIFLPMACGAARVRLPVYLFASLIGAAAWSTVFTLVGYAAGEAAMRVIGRLGHVGEIVGALFVTAVVLGFVRWSRKRKLRKARIQRRLERGGKPTPPTSPVVRTTQGGGTDLHEH